MIIIIFSKKYKVRTYNSLFGNETEEWVDDLRKVEKDLRNIWLLGDLEIGRTVLNAYRWV